MNRERIKTWSILLISFCVGALIVGWFINRDKIQELQAKQINSFISAGARFTAQDGQKLCERIKSLELELYGFINS